MAGTASSFLDRRTFGARSSSRSGPGDRMRMPGMPSRTPACEVCRALPMQRFRRLQPPPRRQPGPRPRARPPRFPWRRPGDFVGSASDLGARSATADATEHRRSSPDGPDVDGHADADAGSVGQVEWTGVGQASSAGQDRTPVHRPHRGGRRRLPLDPLRAHLAHSGDALELGAYGHADDDDPVRPHSRSEAGGVDRDRHDSRIPS